MIYVSGTKTKLKHSLTRSEGNKNVRTGKQSRLRKEKKKRKQDKTRQKKRKKRKKGD